MTIPENTEQQRYFKRLSWSIFLILLDVLLHLETLKQDSLEHREERQLQIYNAFRVEKANRAINILLEIRHLLHLQGDFSSIISRKVRLENRWVLLLACLCVFSTPVLQYE